MASLLNIESFVWSDYIPHEPTYKQATFLALSDVREVFYGGAPG